MGKSCRVETINCFVIPAHHTTLGVCDAFTTFARRPETLEMQSQESLTEKERDSDFEAGLCTL